MPQFISGVGSRTVDKVILGRNICTQLCILQTSRIIRCAGVTQPNSLVFFLSGRCICKSGYSGPRCDRPCPKGFYGVGCKQACPPCTSGYGTCDFLTGQCECEPGYTGFFCAGPCPRGTFGRRCLGKCDCKVCTCLLGNQRWARSLVK